MSISAYPLRGLLLPIVLVAIGGVFLYLEDAWLWGQWGWYPIPSRAASITQGLIFITWGVGLHLRYAWLNARRFAQIADVLGVAAYLITAGLVVAFLGLCLRYVMR